MLFVALRELPSYDPALATGLPVICGLLTLLSLHAGMVCFTVGLLPPIYYASPELGVAYAVGVALVLMTRSEPFARGLFYLALILTTMKTYLPLAVLLVAALELSPSGVFWLGFSGGLMLEVAAILYGAPLMGNLIRLTGTPLWQAGGRLPPLTDLSWIADKMDHARFAAFYGKLFSPLIQTPGLIAAPALWGGTGLFVRRYRTWGVTTLATVLGAGCVALALTYYVGAQMEPEMVTTWVIVPATVTAFAISLAWGLIEIRVSTRIRQATAAEIAEEVAAGDHPVDSLTGLLSREFLKTPFDQLLDAASMNGGALSFAMMDLDRFKQINDTKGHQAGDRVLQDASNILSSCVRDAGRVVRYAGDEFCVVFPSMKIDTAHAIMDDVAEALEKHEFGYLDNVLRPTFSIGLAEFPSMTSTKEDLISLADDALYMSKNMGRNTITVYGERDYQEEALQVACWMRLQMVMPTNGRIRVDSWRLRPGKKTIEVVTLFDYSTKTSYVSKTAAKTSKYKTYKSSFLGKVEKVTKVGPDLTRFRLLVQKEDLPIKIRRHLQELAREAGDLR